MSDEIQIKITPNIEKAIDLEKQIRFGTALALNETAKEAQAAVIEDIERTFTVRGPWYLPGNKFGIKTERATRDNLHTAIKTEAYWLVRHETGGIKEPQNAANLAIPTENVRRSKREKIVSSHLPRNLKDAFVLNMRSGPALFIRRARKGLVRLYNLERQAKIEKNSTVVDTTVNTFRTRFRSILPEKIAHAFRTAN